MSTEKHQHSSHRGSLLPAPMFVLSLSFLSFLLGFASAYFQVFPCSFLANALKGGKAAFNAYQQRSAEFRPQIWYPRRFDFSGGVRVNALGDDDSYLLYLAASKTQAYLIDNSGKQIYQWSKPFREVWPESPHVGWPVKASHTHWRRAHPFPNGDLLVLFIGMGDTPSGYGPAKIDKHSDVKWRYNERVHHDLDVAPNGGIYTLISHIAQKNHSRSPRFSPPYIDDSSASETAILQSSPPRHHC